MDTNHQGCAETPGKGSGKRNMCCSDPSCVVSAFSAAAVQVSPCGQLCLQTPEVLGGEQLKAGLPWSFLCSSELSLLSERTSIPNLAATRWFVLLSNESIAVPMHSRSCISLPGLPGCSEPRTLGCPPGARGRILRCFLTPRLRMGSRFRLWICRREGREGGRSKSCEHIT